ncbi:hypothetical protein B0T22DRAFT_448878 [Podospora appendiculata]|uniref:WW domain-containing protein n=1 Tax=Podospora appendiculata TaxID=314037 RepID=A0AAE0XGJ8_9PEZI|nr:hypothetical protein B0T22DRAFT_448878 [Podospora appendiculata]
MLKSTYKPSPGGPQPLLPGWTEHKAPTGHTYYYNAETKQSTYTRPAAPPHPAMNPSMSYLQHQAIPQINLSDPAVANAFMAQYNRPPPQQQQQQHGQRGGFGPGAGRGGGFQSRPRPQPVDKPRSKVAIPGHEPWILVYTKYGRRFAYNPAKNASYWRIPEKLMPAILELDQIRIRQKAAAAAGGGDGEGTPTPQDQQQEGPKARPTASKQNQQTEASPTHDYDSSEYEEVEVTDDENDDDDAAADGSAPKRQRTHNRDPNDGSNAPVEFTEADIAAQLAAMGASYNDQDDDHHHHDDNHENENENDQEMGDGDDDWDEGDEGLPLSDSDARELFKDLLNDFHINPYSPWEKLLEEAKVMDDARYTVLTTTKERKEVWDEWSCAKIASLRAQRATEEKQDPRIPYLALLQAKATPKLYWPEFKRKYKKDDAMRDATLSDKDREKLYREHINRLKLPHATLKADLLQLLAAMPASQLNNQTTAATVPAAVRADLRYISLDPAVRDPLVDGYVRGLGAPPGADARAQEHEDEAARKERDERRRRERALLERERAVAEDKRRQEKKLAFERARLRDEERELERAMLVGKKGLQSQLVSGRDKGQDDEEGQRERGE